MTNTIERLTTDAEQLRWNKTSDAFDVLARRGNYAHSATSQVEQERIALGALELIKEGKAASLINYAYRVEETGDN